ncbi:hypothetical protein NFI96_000965 [Prochilodus magdalenae]|nr:hypothetical protein NFI96_000965 [Prochilodus magdalenae]
MALLASGHIDPPRCPFPQARRIVPAQCAVPGGASIMAMVKKGVSFRTATPSNPLLWDITLDTGSDGSVGVICQKRSSVVGKRLSWSDSEWQRVIFSDESRFSLEMPNESVCGDTVVSTKMDGLLAHVQKAWCYSTSTPTAPSAETVSPRSVMLLVRAFLYPLPPKAWWYPWLSKLQAILQMDFEVEDVSSQSEIQVIKWELALPDDVKMLGASEGLMRVYTTQRDFVGLAPLVMIPPPAVSPGRSVEE